MATSKKPATSSPVTVRPPVELVRPASWPLLPAERELPGPVLFQPKMDGFRAAGFHLDAGRTLLQSRSGRDLTADFPDIARALTTLPEGTVVDGELVAWNGAHIDFTQLLRTPAARARDGIHVTYVVFDLLAEPGRDLRARTAGERWEVLSRLMAGVRPPLQQIIATTDRTEALRWLEQMQPFGVEGLVVKTLDGRYLPGVRAGWWKVRHADTTDADLVGITGPVTRPEACLVRLPDGRQEVTAPRLTGPQAQQVAAAVAGRLDPATAGPAARIHWVAEPQPVVEVLAGSGRHGDVRYIRLRPPD
ncbi:DNA ligase [Kitasatospora sp. DSM 101779]|uniref:ATP-dependent DNA ligase n=1 Tax=Kitasatospora sp. DSM 101779 TaxID=2853165 RepID=UPI0021D843F7|nr:DNA ligase [Kitasatospora sp. DSM 101779]MCU7827237.1 DNA ligase [Kitasatospora sp. DSM 101779]